MLQSENSSALIEELRVAEEEIRAQSEALEESQFLVTQERDRYRKLFDHAPVPYLVTDRNGVLREANAAAATLLRCRAERLRGKPLAVFVSTGHRIGFRRQLDLAVAGTEPRSVLLKVTPRSGPERAVTGTVAPVTTSDGDILELRWVLVGARAEAVRAARSELSGDGDGGRRVDRAERALRDVSELIAWASHELRTPIASIGGYADLLAMGVRGTLTPDQQALVVRLQQAQSHVTSLLEDLLVFTRTGTGTLGLDVQRVSLENVVERLAIMLEPQAAQRGVRLAIDGATGIWLTADADRTLQILVNLGVNAINFAPRAGHVNVRCRAVGQNVQVAVRDSGDGVPAESRERIFEPYVQLPRPREERVVGSGLGLAISRRLARVMNGDLVCQGAPEGGTEFVLRLPRSMTIAGNS